MAKSKANATPQVSNFDFSDVFDEVETSSRIQSIEVRERLDANIAISSGSLALDLVILHGGYYPGRAYDLVGPESGGKCIIGDSLIPTPAGFYKIVDLVGQNIAEDELTEKKVTVYTRNGLATTSHVYFKNSDTVKITLSNGMALCGTPEHPVMVINKDYNFSWRRLDEITVGTSVLSTYGTGHHLFSKDNASIEYMNVIDRPAEQVPEFNSTYTIKSVTKTEDKETRLSTIEIVLNDETKFKGNPDNAIGLIKDGKLIFSSFANAEVGDRVFLIRRSFGFIPFKKEASPVTTNTVVDFRMTTGLAYFIGKIMSSSNFPFWKGQTIDAENLKEIANSLYKDFNVSINLANPAEAVQYLKSLFTYLGVTEDKNTLEIPWSILTSTEACVKEFINAFIDQSQVKDINLESKNISAKLIIPSEKLSEQIQLMLFSMNVYSSLKREEGNNELTILNTTITPVLSVASVEAGESQPVYDLTIPDGHEFIANNLVVHNTTSGNTVLGEALSFVPKYSVGQYYDYEGSLDTTWFMNIAGMPNDDPESIFGKRDKEGSWIIKPRIRLYKPSFGEQGLILMTKHLNSLPDKGMFRDEWWYTWTPVEAKVKKQTGGLTAKDIEDMLKQRSIQWDKDFLKKNKLYGVRIPENYGGCEGIMFVDSWASMTPRQTAEDNSAAMAQQGRMFSKYINQVKTLISNKGWICLGVNQVRQNPNVRFGCFDYGEPVLTEDGTYIPIGKISDDNMLGLKVLSFNKESGVVEPKRITKIWKRELTPDDVTVRFCYASKHSTEDAHHSVCATVNHVIYQSDGGRIIEKEAGQFAAGDILCGLDSGDEIQVENIHPVGFTTKFKYDLEVEDNHNYYVGYPAILVSNSSEYQPGGEALKHFCDCRNRYGSVSNPNGGGQVEIENNGQDEYRHFKVRNKKNKISTPYGEIEGRYWTKRDGQTGCGIDPVLDTLKYLEYTDQIEKTRKGLRIALNDNSKASGKLNELKFSYNDFKKLILNNEVDTGKRTAKFNLRNHCKKQIKSGIAFDLYYKAVGNGNNKENDNEGEAEDE